PDRLWRNTESGFVDATGPAGIAAPYGEDRAGRGVAWADFDDDSDQDCFVANYRLQENFLWLNRGDGTFENAAPRLGVAGDEVDGWFGHTIGAAWADFDNDGDLDLFTADLAHPRYIEFSNRSRLYENLGPGAEPRFRDVRAKSGIRYEETHSNPAWADVDNDGDLDLYITSIYEGRRSFLYENLGRPFPDSCVLFRETTWLSGTRADNGWGCAFADFDNDGDMDLVVGSGSGVRLYRNDLRPGNHWLQVRVVGRRANRAGIGCRVTVRRGDEAWIREVSGGSGTTSQDMLVQHFGLGESDAPVDVEVNFGSGRARRLEGVPPGWRITVEEPD
ncbi:CRTAC1 family protein, partial [candidate division WOR-3 bacterium]|nr:CRTAC1 family protein [candidate division WOR-3 bacterium]